MVMVVLGERRKKRVRGQWVCTQMGKREDGAGEPGFGSGPKPVGLGFHGPEVARMLRITS